MSSTQRRTCRALLAVASSLLLGGVAHAQAPAQEGVGAEDPGIKLGRLRLRPRISLYYAFDSNVFLRDSSSNETGPGPTSAHRLHVAPGLSLTSAPDAPIDFAFGGGVDYRQYFSDNQTVKQLSDIAATADLGVTFNPKGDVAFSLLNNFRRTTAAPTIELPTPFARDYNRVGARLAVQPGGKALTFDLYYYFNYDHFESFGYLGAQGPRQSTVLSLDNTAHDIALKGRWKFLPKTAVTLDIGGTIWRWDSSTFVSPNIFRATVGLVGNLTPRFSGAARIGYGNSFHEAGDSFNSVVDDLELAYAIAHSTNARLTYARDFAPSTWGNYFGSHALSLSVDSNLWRRLALTAQATYMRVAFNANPPQSQLTSSAATLLSASARADNIFGVTAGATVKLHRFVALNASYVLSVRTSNNGLQFSTVQGQIVDRFGFFQHVLNAGVSVNY